MNSISTLAMEILNDASLGYTKIQENCHKKVHTLVLESVYKVINISHVYNH